MKVLVTGASGFIGSALLPALVQQGREVVACSRTEPKDKITHWHGAPELSKDADWTSCLVDVDVVVHLAGRAHVVSERVNPDISRLYWSINVEATRSLARQAADAGVRHFVFVSSCHAVAAQSQEILTENTQPNPTLVYGKSKLAAEEALRAELASSDCAWTILRPPLVYGPGNRANFERLMRLVRSGIPLPFSAIQNRRSFIYVGNLADVISLVAGNQSSFDRTFFPSDGQDLSTPDLVRHLAAALDCPVRMFPVPECFLRLAAALPGGGSIGKLNSSLFVDCGTLRRDLGWEPRFSVVEGLAKAVC